MHVVLSPLDYGLLVALHERVDSHQAVLYRTRQLDIVLIPKFIIELQKSGERDGIAGEDSDLNLEFLFGKGKQFPFFEMKVDIYILESVGSLPFANSNRIVSMILQDYSIFGLESQRNDGHEYFIAIEFYTRKDSTAFQLERYMRYFLLTEDYVETLGKVSFLLRAEDDFNTD